MAQNSSPKPQAAPRRHEISAAGTKICVYEWGHNRPEAPVVLLAHATGFHARCWDRVVAHLGEQHAFAVDLRGHGLSEKMPIEHWGVFGKDLCEVIEELDLNHIVGVGHSMGGHAMTEAAARLGDRFQRLVLIDPVIGPPQAYPGSGRFPPGEPHPTIRRKNHFDSPEAMIERFRQRKPYSDFHPKALEDYCRFGLIPDPEGPGFILACPPSVEASIYGSSFSNPGVHDSVGSVFVPTLVVRAKEPPPDRSIMDFSYSPTWPGLAAKFPHGEDLHLPDETHFIPLEKPEYTAGLITNRP